MMELELEKEHIVGYELKIEKNILQEETLESIVPDACPDIFRIADVCGCAVITEKQVRGEAAAALGAAKVTVLYEPESETGLCRMNLDIPFTCQIPAPGLTDNGKLIVSVRLRHAEARVLNPRKVLLRAELDVGFQVYDLFERSVCCGVLSGQTDHLCQKMAEVQDCCVCDVTEKPFPLETRLRLKTGLGDNVQVLSLSAIPVCSDCKVIGSKLIFKGAVDLAVLIQDSSMELNKVQETIPFSQIMEVNGGENNTGSDLALELQSLSWSQDEEDDGLLSVSLELLAQISVRQSRTITLLEDLYSTRNYSECETELVSFQELGEETTTSQSVRELVEADPPIHTLIDSRISFGEAAQSRQEKEIQLSVPAELEIFYLDQELHLHHLYRELPVTCRVDCTAGEQCKCSCNCPEGVYAAPSVGGAEVRFNAEFHCRMTHTNQIGVISSAKLGDDRGRGENERPSVVLRLASGDESLWDIAKAYGTTEERIAAANGLEGTSFPAGVMLLIPASS